jgi:type IV secretory pathway VirB6-like protein
MLDIEKNNIINDLKKIINSLTIYKHIYNIHFLINKINIFIKYINKNHFNSTEDFIIFLIHDSYDYCNIINNYYILQKSIEITKQKNKIFDINNHVDDLEVYTASICLLTLSNSIEIQKTKAK